MEKYTLNVGYQVFKILNIFYFFTKYSNGIGMNIVQKNKIIFIIIFNKTKCKNSYD